MAESDPPASASRPESDPIVCYCMAVPASALRAAVAAGARTIEDLQLATAACTGCGTCRLDLLGLLGLPMPEAPEAG